MNNTRKIKINKLNFYTVDDKYIEYLKQFDKHIAYNKSSKRPYIGTVFIMEEYYYFAPMFSPKQKHTEYKNNLTIFKIINEKTKNKLGIIKFSDMIPVPLKSISILDFKDKSYGYKRLIHEQYSYINKTENKNKIIEKAEKIYTIVTNNRKNKLSNFYKSISCDFKLLEEKCLAYCKQ